jgi:hypothetical protein
MKFSLTILLLISAFLVSCTEPEQRIVEFYKSGNKKFEVPTRQGRWHGKARGFAENGQVLSEILYVDNRREGYGYEYYPSGKLQGKAFYRHDVAIATMDFFLESGELRQRTILTTKGIPIDFQRFNKDGSRDYSHMYPILYVVNDSIRTKPVMAGTPATLYVKLGNADSTQFSSGSLVITSAIQGENVTDTLFLKKGFNKNGFQYTFRPTNLGSNFVRGALIFKRPGKKEGYKRFTFEYNCAAY